MKTDMLSGVFIALSPVPTKVSGMHWALEDIYSMTKWLAKKLAKLL